MVKKRKRRSELSREGGHTTADVPAKKVKLHDARSNQQSGSSEHRTADVPQAEINSSDKLLKQSTTKRSDFVGNRLSNPLALEQRNHPITPRSRNKAESNQPHGSVPATDRKTKVGESKDGLPLSSWSGSRDEHPNALSKSSTPKVIDKAGGNPAATSTEQGSSDQKLSKRQRKKAKRRERSQEQQNQATPKSPQRVVQSLNTTATTADIGTLPGARVRLTKAQRRRLRTQRQQEEEQNTHDATISSSSQLNRLCLEGPSLRDSDPIDRLRRVLDPIASADQLRAVTQTLLVPKPTKVWSGNDDKKVNGDGSKPGSPPHTSTSPELSHESSNSELERVLEEHHQPSSDAEPASPTDHRSALLPQSGLPDRSSSVPFETEENSPHIPSRAWMHGDAEHSTNDNRARHPRPAVQPAFQGLAIFKQNMLATQRRDAARAPSTVKTQVPKATSIPSSHDIDNAQAAFKRFSAFTRGKQAASSEEDSDDSESSSSSSNDSDASDNDNIIRRQAVRQTHTAEPESTQVADITVDVAHEADISPTSPYSKAVHSDRSLTAQHDSLQPSNAIVEGADDTDRPPCDVKLATRRQYSFHTRDSSGASISVLISPVQSGNTAPSESATCIAPTDKKLHLSTVLNDIEDVEKTISDLAKDVLEVSPLSPEQRIPISARLTKVHGSEQAWSELRRGISCCAGKPSSARCRLHTPVRIICNPVRVPDEIEVPQPSAGESRRLLASLAEQNRPAGDAGANVKDAAVDVTRSRAVKRVRRGKSKATPASSSHDGTSTTAVPSSPTKEEGQAAADVPNLPLEIGLSSPSPGVPALKKKRGTTGVTSRHFSPTKKEAGKRSRTRRSSTADTSLQTIEKSGDVSPRTMSKIRRMENDRRGTDSIVSDEDSRHSERETKAKAKADEPAEASPFEEDVTAVGPRQTRSATKRAAAVQSSKSKRRRTSTPGEHTPSDTPPSKGKARESPPPSTTKRKRAAAGVSTAPVPPISAERFGIMQERLWDQPFRLLVAAILINKTAGKTAMPVFWNLMEHYPTPQDLAGADPEDVFNIIGRLGLGNNRKKIIIKLAKTWVETPPAKGKRYRAENYPSKGDHRGTKPRDVLEDADSVTGAVEIAHLPGTGAYAWDSWRIACRDVLRGVADDYNGKNAKFVDFEPEWKRVVPGDKELRACLRWMWLREGWIWDCNTGDRRRASEEEMNMARKGEMEVPDEQEAKFARQAVEREVQQTPVRDEVSDQSPSV